MVESIKNSYIAKKYDKLLTDSPLKTISLTISTFFYINYFLKYFEKIRLIKIYFNNYILLSYYN